jgi:hypothetical protein
MNDVLDDSNVRKEGSYLECMCCVSYDMYSQNALFGKEVRSLIKLPLFAVDMLVSCVLFRLVLMGKRNDRERAMIQRSLRALAT